MSKPMTPDQIKHAIKAAKQNQVKIANACEVSAPFINQVIKGDATSHKVRCYIAKIINIPVERIWTIKPNPTKTGPG